MPKRKYSYSNSKQVTLDPKVLSRARIIFSIVLLALFLTFGSSVYAGIKSGNVQKATTGFINNLTQGIIDAFKEPPAPYSTTTINTYIATSSSSLKINIQDNISPQPKSTPTPAVKYYPPYQVKTPAVDTNNSTQTQDEWWKKVQEQNDQWAKESQERLNQFKSSSDQNYQNFVNQGNAGFEEFREQNEQQQAEFKAKYGVQ
jgi:hypothetical protein